jgi:hypothetical protein
MNKTKRAESMERLRKERKEQGLVEFRCWCAPEHREKLRALATELERGQESN